jgi:hypothetical protein
MFQDDANNERSGTTCQAFKTYPDSEQNFYLDSLLLLNKAF